MHRVPCRNLRQHCSCGSVPPLCCRHFLLFRRRNKLHLLQSRILFRSRRNELQQLPCRKLFRALWGFSMY